MTNVDDLGIQARIGSAVIEAELQAMPIPVTLLREELPNMPDCGGYVCFEGVVRNINHGKPVVKLEYEAYVPLAKKELARVCAEAAAKFDLRFVRAIHREGSLAIGEPAVVVQVLSRHRTEAFDGCRYVIDQLKARVPIWKKEHYADGSTEWTRCHHAPAHEHEHEHEHEKR
jgi:molybdopterin synthase catalytic subunit